MRLSVLKLLNQGALPVSIERVVLFLHVSRFNMGASGWRWCQGGGCFYLSLSVLIIIVRFFVPAAEQARFCGNHAAPKIASNLYGINRWEF